MKTARTAVDKEAIMETRTRIATVATRIEIVIMATGTGIMGTGTETTKINLRLLMFKD